MKVPASVTESGFVPPTLNTNERAVPPFVNEPVPNGLVKVITLPTTVQSPGLELITPPVDERVQRD